MSPLHVLPPLPVSSIVRAMAPRQQLERMVIFQCNCYGELGQLVLKYREIYGNITYSNFYIQSTLKVP